MTQQTDRSMMLLLIVLAVAMAFGPISVDFFTPFLPGVTRNLGWSILQLQVSIYSFFMGYGLAPFVWGGLADHYGRRKVMLAGLIVYCIGTVFCMLAMNIGMFTVARFVQGAGAATGVVLSRVILRDIHGPHGATRAISSMYLIMVWIPMVVPLLGGYMALKFAWQAGFAFMLLTGLLTLAASYYLLMETFPSTRSTRPRGTARWRGILSNRIFLNNALTNMFGMSVLLLFLSNYAYLTDELYQFSSEQNEYAGNPDHGRHQQRDHGTCKAVLFYPCDERLQQGQGGTQRREHEQHEKQDCDDFTKRHLAEGNRQDDEYQAGALCRIEPEFKHPGKDSESCQ